MTVLHMLPSHWVGGRGSRICAGKLHARIETLAGSAQVRRRHWRGSLSRLVGTCSHLLVVVTRRLGSLSHLWLLLVLHDRRWRAVRLRVVALEVHMLLMVVLILILLGIHILGVHVRPLATVAGVERHIGVVVASLARRVASITIVTL